MPPRMTSGWSTKALHAFNFEATRIPYASQPVNLFLRTESGEIKGGLIGRVLAGWVHIGTLWVDVEYRHRGYEAQLMRNTEEEGRRKGCKYVWLDTSEFQARSFYGRLGYTSLGVPHDHPLGHTHYFMYKRSSEAWI